MKCLQWKSVTGFGEELESIIHHISQDLVRSCLMHPSTFSQTFDLNLFKWQPSKASSFREAESINHSLAIRKPMSEPLKLEAKPLWNQIARVWNQYSCLRHPGRIESSSDDGCAVVHVHNVWCVNNSNLVTLVSITSSAGCDGEPTEPDLQHGGRGAPQVHG